MWWQTFTAFSIMGMAGSLHCVGMCGPLALALPTHVLAPHQKFWGLLLYHTGRISTYTSLGILFGWLGKHIYLAGGQQTLSISLGLCILVLAGLRWMKQSPKTIKPYLNFFYSFIQQKIAGFLSKPTLSTMFLVGLANGLLPCGMIYFAISGAVALGHIGLAAIGMLGFGIGTIPLMLALGMLGMQINLQARNFVKKISPIFTCIIAILLILRGLHLNIPYLSPAFSNQAHTTISCH